MKVLSPTHERRDPKGQGRYTPAPAYTTTTGGSGNWSPVAGGYYGNDSAQSPTLSLNQESWLQTTVQGPGTFSFYAKLSAAYSDPQPTPPDDFAAATECLIPFTTGGAVPWQVAQTQGYGDYDSAESGPLSTSQSNWLQTTVEGEGTFSFWWMAESSDPGSSMYFYVDGVAQSSVTGAQDWEQKTYTITGSGTHTLKWTFSRSSYPYASARGYVDNVGWTGATGQEIPPAPVRFYIDGVEQYGCKTNSWEQKSYSITGSGTHTLRWVYGRYRSDWSGTGSVDAVGWTGYIEQPPIPPAPVRFYVDGVEQYGCKTDSWEQKSYSITGSGPHTLRWVFGRYRSDWSGTGAVDAVGWTGYVEQPPAQPEPDPEPWHFLRYVYDASGRRIEKKYDDTTQVRYVYDGDQCLAEYDSSNQLLRKYIYGPGIDQPISMIESSGSYAGTYYYHFDGLGSVVALTSGNVGSMGNTVEVYEYDVYGRVGALDADHPNRFMFTGREYDKETGLYYYRARYYNPQIGRFLQTDLVGYEAGMNCYRYCGNSPTGRTDPSGCLDVTHDDYTWLFEFSFPASCVADPGVIEHSDAGDLMELVDQYFRSTGYYKNWPAWAGISGAWLSEDKSTITVRFYSRENYSPDKTGPLAPNMSVRIADGGVPIVFVDDIGLLTLRAFNKIMAPAFAMVDSWESGSIWNIWQMYRHLALDADSWFRTVADNWTFLWEDRVGDPQRYRGNTINFAVVGYALAHYGEPDRSVPEFVFWWEFVSGLPGLKLRWPWNPIIQAETMWGMVGYLRHQ